MASAVRSGRSSSTLSGQDAAQRSFSARYREDSSGFRVVLSTRENLRERLPAHLVQGSPEQRLGRWVEIQNPSLGIGANHAVGD